MTRRARSPAAHRSRSRTTAGSSKRTAPSGSTRSARSTPRARDWIRAGNLCPPLPVESLGYNFHTANMPVIAQGCVGRDLLRGRSDRARVPGKLRHRRRRVPRAAGCERSRSSRRCERGPEIRRWIQASVHLDPNKRYFISILPGDGVNPTIGGAGGPDDSGKPFDIAAACGPYVLDTSLTGTSPWAPGAPSAICGHAMGGAQISPVQVASAGTMPINIGLQETPAADGQDRGVRVRRRQSAERRERCRRRRRRPRAERSRASAVSISSSSTRPADSVTPPVRSPTTCSTSPCPTPWRARSIRSPGSIPARSPRATTAPTAISSA